MVTYQVYPVRGRIEAPWSFEKREERDAVPRSSMCTGRSCVQRSYPRNGRLGSVGEAVVLRTKLVRRLCMFVGGMVVRGKLPLVVAVENVFNGTNKKKYDIDGKPWRFTIMFFF